MKPKVIALHGDYGSPEMLRRDMNNPSWVDMYFDAHGWKDFEVDFERLDETIRLLGRVALVGFSRGVSAIAKLSTDPFLATLICGAVVYEGPVLDSDRCGGSFPVLQIWNDNGRLKQRRSTRQAIDSMKLWQENRDSSLMIGSGGHMEVLPPAHAWDCSLNDRIAGWLERIVL